MAEIITWNLITTIEYKIGKNNIRMDPSHEIC